MSSAVDSRKNLFSGQAIQLLKKRQFTSAFTGQRTLSQAHGTQELEVHRFILFVRFPPLIQLS